MDSVAKRHRVAFFFILTIMPVAYGEVYRLSESEVAAEFQIRIWQREHGLPDQRVKAVLQSKDGYLWLATQQGLARFDGREFTVFNSVNTPAFVSDDCEQIVEDGEGSLWITTRDGIVNKSGSRFTRHTEAAGIGEFPFILPVRPRGIVAARDWSFGFLDSQGFRCFNRSGHFSAQLSSRNHYVTTVLTDEADAFWFATWGGILKYSADGQLLDQTPLGKSFENVPATALWRGKHGEFWALFSEEADPPDWISAKRWLACFKNGEMLRAPNFAQADYESGRPEFIVPDSYGALWLGPTKNGIHRFVNGKFQLLPLPTSLDEDFPLCVAEDREGSLWIGTADGGLQQWLRRKVRNYGIREGLSHENTWTITQARDGGMWIGTDNGVTRFYKGNAEHYLTNLPPPASNVRSVVEDQQGAIWIGTIRGLHRVYRGAITNFVFPGEWFQTKIRSLLPAQGGGVWVGTVRGLSRLEGDTRVQYTRADGLGSDEVLAMLEGHDGTLWIGTFEGGLSKFQEGKFSTLTTTHGLCSNNVWALHEDSDRVLWIGTENGLNRLKGDTLTSFTVTNGLPSNLVNTILEDDSGRLWIGHDHGIYWVRREEFNDVAEGKTNFVIAVSYDESDGLPSKEINGKKSFPVACKTRDGRLWFPTIRGVAAVDPTKAIPDEVSPLTVIEEMRANGETVGGNLVATNTASFSTGTTPVRLPPGGGRWLEFRYTANTFLAPEKARFRYRLRGLSEKWVDNGTRREAHFTDLHPGIYTFEIMARNHHGVWPQSGAAIAFQLTPFFYQTAWFYLVAAAVLASVIASGLTWRMRELRRIHELERVSALDEQRKRIARDVHDELGASLTNILQLTQADSLPNAAALTSESRNQRIASIAEAAVDNMAEIVWANNPEFDTLNDLVAYLREYAATFLEPTAIEVEFDFPEYIPPCSVNGFVRRHVLLIVKEALHNVVKHASATRARISLALHQRQLTLLIADDGCGLPENGLRRFGNGLANMRSRVNELGGIFEIRSADGEGTELRVQLCLPADGRQGI